MKKLNIAINLPDNGGITFFGPLITTPTASKVPASYRDQRMYLCASQDPEEVGKVLMAMLADLQMSERPIPTADLDREVGEITF